MLMEGLLRKYEITREEFSKRGRPPVGIREKRAQIVTELHQSGLTWDELMRVTGLSNGSIQRLTQAKGCEQVQVRLREQGRRMGADWKGKKRPGQLERQWASGVFDQLRGACLSEERKAALRATWTEERRQRQGAATKRTWANPGTRARLLAFHRSPEERARRSREQAERILLGPGKWARGNGCYVIVAKEVRGRIWVRSSYESAAVSLLEGDPLVVSYQYEPKFKVGDRWIVPDFLVERRQSNPLLVEVKASWVLGLPLPHKVQRRLSVARTLAQDHGWDFEIWTEKEALYDFL